MIEQLSDATIKRIVELYKQWYSNQLDGSFVEYIRKEMAKERADAKSVVNQ